MKAKVSGKIWAVGLLPWNDWPSYLFELWICCNHFFKMQNGFVEYTTWMHASQLIF